MSTAKKIGLSLKSDTRHGGQIYTLTKSKAGADRYVLTIRNADSSCQQVKQQQQS